MYKKFLKILLYSIYFSQVLLYSQDSQNILQEANKFYKSGNFEKAYNYYQKIKSPNAKINYNLGNCAYKLHKYGYALLYWKRAEKNWGMFNRQELTDNIKLLKNKLFPESNKKNNLFRLKETVTATIKVIPLFVLQVLFLLLWLFLFWYIKFLYKRKYKTIITILFILIATLGTILAIRYNLEYKAYGITLTKDATLLSGPGKNFQELAPLPQASEVVIKKSSDRYYKIKFKKIFGWTAKTNIGKV